MASILDDLLGSELGLMFFISVAVWIMIFVYLFYTNSRMKRLEKELKSLKDD
ncbi:MAG: CcmD family protein [Candidatus Hodarchaeales archaeon]|jgi:CcmD family protein